MKNGWEKRPKKKPPAALDGPFVLCYVGGVRVRLIMSFAPWFERCEGKWVSHRRYLMGPKKSIDNLVTEFDIVRRAEDEWAVLWASDRNEGEMGIILDGDTIKRSRNYFEGEEGTITKLEYVDDDTVVFLSSYGGMDYREEIRFLNGNKFRLRQTVGYKEGTDKVIVIGQYWEEQV